ncbi:MAG TPA: tetratricopeptide repeat-containing serine protease family protein [Bryocella sp.]|nr:tetratricopeptide repeat-containing serine protease family protein [Bryocella sp.]
MRANLTSKLRLVGLALIIWAGSVPCCSQNPDAAKQIYKGAADSVFLVYLNDASGSPTALGTAFVVGPRTLITNAHVVSSGTPVLAVGPVRIPIRVVRRDEKNDLALLRVDVDLTSTALPLRDTVPSPGERVYAIGNPEGLEKSISEGLISAVRSEGGRKLLQISSPISHGSSGGPILDSQGRVVGVAVGILPDGENLNFAVPVEFVREIEAAAARSNDVEDAVAPQIPDVEVLLARKDKEAYSSDQDSPYQLASAKFGQAMHTAVTLTRKVNDLRQLACLGVRSWDAIDDGIAAARNAYTSTPTVGNSALLAYSLYQGAALQYVSAAFAKDGSDEQHKAQEAERRFLGDASKIALQTKTANGKLDDVAIFVLGGAADQLRNFAGATEYFEKIAGHPVQECGNDLRMLAMRDLISEAAALKHDDEAEGWFRKFTQTYSPSASDWNSEGDRRFQAKDYLVASDAYERAAAADAGYGYDLCYASVGRFLQPSTDEDKVLSDGRDCQDASVKNSDQNSSTEYEKELPVAHLFMGIVLEKRGVYSGALENEKEALSALPGNSLALATEADIFADTARYQECVSAEQAAIAASDGKYADNHFKLGYCYFELENWAMAETSFRKAIQIDPSNATAMYDLGLSVQRQGFTADARHWFLEASKLKADPETRQKIQDALRN